MGTIFKGFKTQLFLNKQAVVFITIACLLFINLTTIAQQKTDTLKYQLKFITGIKTFLYSYEKGARVGSILGLDLKPTSKRYEFFFRNYFHLSTVVGDTLTYKGYPQQESTIAVYNFTNEVGINRYFKNNKYKYGLAAYYENRHTGADKIFGIASGKSIGFEWSFYSKFKWVNVAFKHQFQILGHQEAPPLKFILQPGALESYRFSICIEIPINLKY